MSPIKANHNNVIRMTFTDEELALVFDHLDIPLKTDNTLSWEMKAKLFDLVGLEKPKTPKEIAVENTQRYRKNKKAKETS